VELNSAETRIRHYRWAITVGVGLTSAALVAIVQWNQPASQWDALQFLIAAKALASGSDPYAAVATSNFGFPLFYPLPAVAPFVPLAMLPAVVVRMLWAGLTMSALAWAGTTSRPALLVACVSGSAFDAVLLGQYSPLITAAAVLPWMGAAWAAKPSVGLAMFAGYPSRSAAISIVVVTLLSLALWPAWPMAWWSAIKTQIHSPAILRPGGALLLLALLRWRRPESRMLGVLAFVPVTTSVYDTLSLFLIPQTLRASLTLALLSFLAMGLQVWLVPWTPGSSLADVLDARWGVVFALVWLPALAMTLWPRKVVADVPDGLVRADAA
jgi:hypothetical protein